jgi:hypothetical protein
VSADNGRPFDLDPGCFRTPRTAQQRGYLVRAVVTEMEECRR